MSDVENYYPLTDEILEGLKENPYYAGHKKDQLVFYVEVYKKVVLEARTYVKAYNELGFDTTVLGEVRVNVIGMRIMKLADEHRLFRIDFTGIKLGQTEFGIIPDQEVIYLLSERVELMCQLLEAVQEASQTTPNS